MKRCAGKGLNLCECVCVSESGWADLSAGMNLNVCVCVNAGGCVNLCEGECLNVCECAERCMHSCKCQFVNECD